MNGKPSPPGQGRSLGSYALSLRYDLKPCGHRHCDAADDFGSSLVGRTYRVSQAVEVWTARDGSGPHHQIVLKPPTLMRCEAWTGAYEPHFRVEWFAYRFLILVGPLAGQCVEIGYDHRDLEEGWPGLEPIND